MDVESQVSSVVAEFSQLDTGQWSILHFFFTRAPAQKITLWRSYFAPYVITALLFYGLPFAVALVTLPTLTTRSSELKLPFLYDWNAMCMYLVTLPLLVTLLLTERTFIPARITSIIRAGTLSLTSETAGELRLMWERRYKLVNLWGQLGGVVVGGITSSLLSYYLFTQTGFAGWQYAENGLNIPGWIFLFWQTPIFWCIVDFYIVRGVATSLFLRSLTRRSSIRIVPFHPDNCGGLKPVGKIGLRNQYFLTVAGLNNILFYIVFTQFLDPEPYFYFLIAIVWISYVVFGPIIFIGPLFPFHKSMLAEKERLSMIVADKSRKEYTRIQDHLREEGITKEDEESIDRIQKFKAIVERMPVWPFDTTTLRKFLAAYIFPILTMAASPLFNKLVELLSSLQ